MFMLPEDRKQAAAIERRRRIEEERKNRIFNARQRLIGIDQAALTQQIEEKKAREEEQRKIDKAFDEQCIHGAKLALFLENKIEEEKRHVSQDINAFREVYQRPENRREFDLYDPDGLKKSLPARLLDDDPRCGPSSAQKFAGEDLASEKRWKAQQEQCRSWLEQQITERRAADSDKRAAQKAYDEAVLARDKLACELERMEQECQRRINEANLRFNKALVEEQVLQRRLDEAKELEDKQAEIYNHVTGDMLTENPDVANSNLGPGRKIQYLYKGMSTEERENVRREQLRQIVENEAKRQAQARLETEWQEMVIGIDKHCVLQEREIMRKQRELDKKILEQNKQLAKEQTTKQEYMERVVFTNVPTEAYYDQFNTTTR
ncbi:RIB43A-like with coiled-coils protein 1 [Cryptotermes secundus]|uniref:RIB43A-like with coiled-coils protein 1 n=1 Tax=Cryptotermes secundus TaxID=105785 RepID=A0A2J7PGE0_9NEOP|nr:RIB43A-like with coiled-coils protein 2 [Cryptotermes secundus]PNF15395.1 RIB43A-like with coiled-coils protein 1 [Cryptotermes secundus]